MLPQELEKSLFRFVLLDSDLNSDFFCCFSIGNQLKKQIADTIQKELKTNSIADAGATISRAMTPAMITQEKRSAISRLLASEQYNLAFEEALSASDLNLVVYACEKIRAEQLFLSSPTCPLDQPVLLSLIQQLNTDLGKNSELKSRYVYCVGDFFF